MTMLDMSEKKRIFVLGRGAVCWIAGLMILHAHVLYAVNESGSEEGEWIQLFNGRDIQDWIVKLNHHEVGDNYGNTFRVEDGLLKVRYDQYEDFGNRFGHLYYKQPFSHYHLAVEYRFVGELHRGAPGYAVLNSGVMLHAQDPSTLLKDQDWPISIELQFLAGLPDGRPRGTGNVCTPGTHVSYQGQLTEAHIIESSAKTYPPGQWVRAEAIVHGNDSIVHLINGEKVLEYSHPQIGGGVVSGYDPAVFQVGKALSEGFIALQSEGQPVDFRKVELKVLRPDDPHTSPEPRRVALFDGKTLSGWTVLTCEATVDDGDILIQSGNGLIQTLAQYGDFILEFEWKPLRSTAWDSGVYFRYDAVPQGRPWPPRYQANLKQGLEGNVDGLDGARSEGLVQGDRWNRFKLTVQGTQASLEINGKPAWQAQGLQGPKKGFIALQAEVPGGGQHRFRNLYLTELGD